MPTLEIITIGTELLLGEIQDTNSTYIARTLRDHGIDIFRITTIGDNARRISSAIKEALGRADIIITTGGLGPTIDDPTRQAVADAADQELVFPACSLGSNPRPFQSLRPKTHRKQPPTSLYPQGGYPDP